MQEVKIYREGGAVTLIVPELDETYHNRHGAWEESMHVFIKNGLEKYIALNSDQEGPKRVRILEIGMGTGLNILATLSFLSQNPQIFVEYITLEPYRLSIDILNQLDLPQFIEDESVIPFFNSIHSSADSLITPLGDQLNLKVLEQKLDDFFINNKEDFDVVFFDAFAPKKQPELWTAEVFQNLYSCLSINGVLTTYSANGQVKRNIKSAGFALESPAGAHGKREMSVGVKAR